MPQLAPAVSALARRTMSVAFEDLERTITPPDAREMRSVTAIGQVRAAALEIENQLAARQALRNMRRLSPLLNGLEHYGKVADILCNGTPFLSWIWSPITLILRVASEYIEAFEHIMKGYARIADTLRRFEILSEAFATNLDFQQTIAVFYANVLQFHKHAYKFVRRSSWRLLFLTSWGRFERRFSNILEDLDRHGAVIDNEANARNIAESRQMRQDIRAWREESLEQVKREDEHQAAKQYQSILAWLKIDETEQIATFESISEEGTKYPGTSTWLTKNDKISSWLRRKPEMPFLWLRGSPGSGKSVISAQLMNFLRASKSTVIRHFCTDTYISSTRYDNILRSLLVQLLRQDCDLVAHVYQEYVLNKKLPTFSNLERLLQTHVAALSDEPREPKYLWMIIDGANECETAKQERLVSLLNQISSPTVGGTVLKVLVSARSTPVLNAHLRKKPAICLSDETTSLTAAIRLYASQRLRSLQERLRQLELEPGEIDEIEHLISQKAGGMFLYARLILDYISANIFYSGEELKESISQLPQSLADFYHKLLTQIVSRLDSRSQDRVRCIFGWIAFAKRPLKKLEFLSALSFSSGDPNTAKLAPRYIVEDVCSPLVEERRDTSLAFIHVTVKDFLQSRSCSIRITECDAFQEHGIAAVTCLLSGMQLFSISCPEQKRLLRLVKGVHGFHIYATEYWTEYILANAAAGNDLEASPNLFALACSLAEALDNMSAAMAAQYSSSSSATDERLSMLERYPVLRKQIGKALLARSQERLECELLRQPSRSHLLHSKKATQTASDENAGKPPSNSDFSDGISRMLDDYQKAVQTILDQDFCPGASIEELELFKSQFRASAYTCRVRSCPRATMGFDSEQLLREHEAGHAGGFRCSVAGCQYPVSRTAQALKQHMEKYHDTAAARKSIRRVGRFDRDKIPQRLPETTWSPSLTEYDMLQQISQLLRKYLAQDYSKMTVQQLRAEYSSRQQDLETRFGQNIPKMLVDSMDMLAMAIARYENTQQSQQKAQQWSESSPNILNTVAEQQATKNSRSASPPTKSSHRSTASSIPNCDINLDFGDPS